MHKLVGPEDLLVKRADIDIDLERRSFEAT